MSVTEMSYPIFELNQTLSHHDLNNLFGYLNKQDLLTRANFVGTGIISGLEASFDARENKIIISKGCGITSDGYLVYVPENKSYRFYNKSVDNFLGCAKFPEIKDHYELEDTLREGGGAIDSETLTNNVVVLYYEERDQQISCCAIKDNKGSRSIVTIRVLLVPNGNILANDSLLSRNNNTDENKLTLMQRLETATPNEIVGKSKVIAENIKNNIKAAYNVFSNVLKNVNINTILARIPQGDDNNTLNHYNFFCDLIEAYEEFRVCGEKVLLDYRPTASNFPCHLILNGNYRHHFRPATASNDYSELNRLWERIVTMIDFFDPKVKPATDNSIRLTPSIYGAVPLSEKAIPYYYKKKDGDNPSENQKALDELRKAWTGRKNKIGYWYNESDASYLNYDLEKYNFVRIEGHIGDIPHNSNIQTIVSGINKKVVLFNIPVQVIALISNTDITDPCIEEFENIFFYFLYQDVKDAMSGINTALSYTYTIAGAENGTVKVAEDAIKAAEGAIEAAKNAVKANGVQDDVENAIKAIEAIKPITEIPIPAGEDGPATKEVINVINTAIKEANAAIAGILTAVNGVKTAMATNGNVAEAKEQVAVPVKKAGDAVAPVKKAVDTAAATTAAMAATTADIGTYLQPEEHTTIQNCKIIISFVCNVVSLNSQCKKITSFLHWLDATRTKYQQCKEFISFDEFKKKHPGLQHKSGVPIGGTFILVYNDDNKVIADFCLPYRVTQPD